MKSTLYYIITLMVFTSCSSSRNYMSRLDDDKTIFDAVKALNKNAGDTGAINALPVLYTYAQDRHLKKIAGYNSLPDLSRWSRIIDEYNTLQKMYDVISESPGAQKLVNPVNYQNSIYNIKQTAAEEYYQQGTTLLASDGATSSKEAYQAFKKAEQFVAGYKDVKIQMKKAYEGAIVNVLINPVTDNSFFFNSSWGNYGYNYSNEYFQQTLIRELGGTNANRYPARFYSDWEARRENVKPDIIVNLLLRNMDIPGPNTQYYNRRLSNEVIIGTDTSGKAIYKTVYAQMNITRQQFNATVEMEVDIRDANSRNIISNNIYREYYRWQEETATYEGDERALSSEDWRMINSNPYNYPRKEEVLKELYRKLYPQVKNRISYAVDW